MDVGVFGGTESGSDKTEWMLTEIQTHHNLLWCQR